ncbi:MAG: hypothetical protein [Circular genetic element sp.]|nr:MAG: hypothetical protein [Circular genetic element sp.]
MHIDKIIELLNAAKKSDSGNDPSVKRKKTATKTAKRKPSAYSKKYSKAFKAVKGKHMKKNGGWKKDGYKKAVKAAHAKAKRMK